jgi:enoyl-CoA hydratase/carnithine racemase
MGLVTRVVDPADLATGGRAFARQLAEGPTEAHLATKRILHEWRSSGVTVAEELTHTEGARVIATTDLQNGIQSMLKSGPERRSSLGTDVW